MVFMAEQQQPVRRKVALKVIKPGMDTRQVIARFEAERQALAIIDARAAELVKLRYFAGFTIPEAAGILGVSTRTANELWTYARAWLFQELGGERD